jgi:hypothetical protein
VACDRRRPREQLPCPAFEAPLEVPAIALKRSPHLAFTDAERCAEGRAVAVASGIVALASSQPRRESVWSLAPSRFARRGVNRASHGPRRLGPGGAFPSVAARPPAARVATPARAVRRAGPTAGPAFS